MSGKFNINKTDETASLFLDLLRGLRVTLVDKKKLLYIDQEEYDSLLIKTLSFTNIFINWLIVR